MKKIYRCFDRVVDEELFYKAYLNSQKGKCSRKTRAINFAFNWRVNLDKLRHEVMNMTYKPLPYSVFNVYEPKERVVLAPHYRDKIVQYAVTQVLRDIYEPTFIYDSYSCIRNKGNHRCVARIINFMRRTKRLYNGGYILKMDIKKFFPSINHEILLNILNRKIKDLKMLWLINIIIRSNDKGLNIGNSTSQILANIYLNELDKYIKRNLKCRYYIRYADDIFLFCYNREIAKFYYKNIMNFLDTELNLSAHKIQINTIDYGVVSLGFHFKPTYIRWLRRNIKKVRIYDRECNCKMRLQRLNTSLSSSMTAMTMYVFGIINNLQWDFKRSKYLFKI